MTVLVTKTLRDFGVRRLRSALLLLGIVIGVAGVVAIAYTARNLAGAQRAAYVSASQADLFIGVRNFPPGLTNVILESDNVTTVESRVGDYLQWSNGGPYRDVLIYGVHDFGNIQINRPTLISGRWPGKGEAVLDYSSRQLQAVAIGDTIALRESVASAPVYARISGFTRTPGEPDASIQNRATGYAPAADVQIWRQDAGDNQLLLRLGELRRATETRQAIARILDKRGIAHGQGVIRDPQSAVGTKELGALLLLMSVFSVIGVILSGFLVWNTMTAVMAEEMRQVGILRALGANRWQVLRTYLVPAIVIGFVGSLVGIAVGVIGGGALAAFLGGLIGLALPPFTLAPREVLLGLLVGLGVGIGAAIFPAWQGTRVTALELLRNYGVRADYGVGFVQRFLTRLRGTSAMLAMAVRNTWRRRVRSAVTMLVVGVGAAAFIGTQALNASVSRTVDTLYATYAADAWLSFNRQMTTDFTGELRRDRDIVASEGWVRDDAYVRQTLTDLWGMPSDTALYLHPIIAGRWFSAHNPAEVVVTANLARSLGLHAGDPLTVVVRKREQTYSIVGIVDDESTYLGSHATGKVFMAPENANTLIGRADVADFFAVRFTDSSPPGVNAALRRVEQQFRTLEPQALATYEDRANTQNTIRILTVLLDAMVIVVAVIGLVGLVNTLVLNITERRRELGILRSIGAGGGALIRLLVSEGLVLGALGYGVGLAGGYALARYLVALAGSELFRMQFTASPVVLLLTGALTLVVAAGASVVPGILAARLRPIEAVRYE
ncbi:MAG: ABC transporter permease [Thermomicrobiales bacterium]